MKRKITKLERIKSHALRIAMMAFRIDPSLGTRQAKSLFIEIVAYLQAGMEDGQIVQIVLENHSVIARNGTLPQV